MMIKDAHIHLSFLSNEKLQTYFHAAEKANVQCFALGGYDKTDWLKQIEIKKINPNVKTCFGLHPWVIEEHDSVELNAQWKFLLTIADQADAIGEAGVDRFRTRDEQKIKKQMDYFFKSLELAQNLNKPVVLHVVQAHEMALKTMDQFPKTFGIAHSFSGSFETAQEYIKRNYLISVGPRVLSEGFKHLKETIVQMDMQYLLIESDDSTDPSDLYKVAEKVAELKGCAMDKVLQQTASNFDKVFK